MRPARKTRLLAAAGVCLGLALSAPQAIAATAPGNFERHESPTWTWYAPPGWVSSEGANDIYISSPTGAKYLHYGASAAPCYEPAGFFEYVRDSYANTHQAFSLYSHPLASARYTKVGPVQQLGGSLYFRQTSTFVGRRPSGAQITGELVLDIFAVDAYGTCGERQQVRSAPSRGIGKSLRLLRLVQKLIFGPR